MRHEPADTVRLELLDPVPFDDEMTETNYVTPYDDSSIYDDTSSLSTVRVELVEIDRRDSTGRVVLAALFIGGLVDVPDIPFT